jgi:ABC-type glycerol-3-phosphate transport system permease component
MPYQEFNMHVKKQLRALMVAFGIVAMLFVCIVIVGFIIINQAMRANAMIEQTARMNSQIGVVRSLFVKSDIIARETWVYGQDGGNIPPARHDLTKEIEVLRLLASDNQNQGKNLIRLEETLSRYFGLQDELIKAARESGYEAASRIARDKGSAALNNDVGICFTVLQAEETALLGERSRNAEYANNSLITILVILALAMFFSIPGAFVVAIMTVSERDRIATELRARFEQLRDAKTNSIVLPGEIAVEVLAAIESTSTNDPMHKSFSN